MYKKTKNTVPSTVFIKVDKDIERIKRLLVMAIDHNYLINGGLTIEQYVRENADHMLYLSFDKDGYINFNRYKIPGKQTVLSEKQFGEWLKKLNPC